MRRLGKVVHVTKRGLVVRLEREPRLGETIYDGKRRRVGQLLDLFGRVDSPYALVRPASEIAPDDLAALVGEELFTSEGRSHGRGRKAK
ncbi:MAG: Gar1/Naf1 family protein [Hadesarchaea archaeon]|nr:Gar1/Naf1 family protein [Hadesarchaea archaeon]